MRIQGWEGTAWVSREESLVSYCDGGSMWVRCIAQKWLQKSQSIGPDCSQILPQSSVKPIVHQA